MRFWFDLQINNYEFDFSMGGFLIDTFCQNDLIIIGCQFEFFFIEKKNNERGIEMYKSVEFLLSELFIRLVLKKKC